MHSIEINELMFINKDGVISIESFINYEDIYDMHFNKGMSNKEIGLMYNKIVEFNIEYSKIYNNNTENELNFREKLTDEIEKSLEAYQPADKLEARGLTFCCAWYKEAACYLVWGGLLATCVVNPLCRLGAPAAAAACLACMGDEGCR